MHRSSRGRRPLKSHDAGSPRESTAAHPRATCSPPGRPLGYDRRPGVRLVPACPLRERRVMTSTILTRIRSLGDVLTCMDVLAAAIRTVAKRGGAR